SRGPQPRPQPPWACQGTARCASAGMSAHWTVLRRAPAARAAGRGVAGRAPLALTELPCVPFHACTALACAMSTSPTRAATAATLRSGWNRTRTCPVSMLAAMSCMPTHALRHHTRRCVRASAPYSPGTGERVLPHTAVWRACITAPPLTAPPLTAPPRHRRGLADSPAYADASCVRRLDGCFLALGISPPMARWPLWPGWLPLPSQTRLWALTLHGPLSHPQPHPPGPLESL